MESVPGAVFSSPFGKALILTVRGADASIKPGALAPGSRQEKRSKPAKRAAAESFRGMLSATALTRFAGSIEIWCLTWGSRPRLYADIRSAD